MQSNAGLAHHWREQASEWQKRAVLLAWRMLSRASREVSSGPLAREQGVIRNLGLGAKRDMRIR
jgi:hypothetical protein